MNSIFSKIISLILCLSIFVCTVPAFADDTLYDDTLTHAFDVLFQLGVFSEKDIQAIDPEAKVSRGEFVLAVTNLIGAEGLSHNEGMQGFSDVTASNKYYNSVMVGASLGFINGSGDGKFKPNDKITASAAVKILVSLLGWDDAAQSKGGYPSGYFAKANELELMDGLSFGYEESITMRDVIILLYNTISADILVIDSISGDSVSYSVNDDGILAQYRGICKSTGKLLGSDSVLLCSNERPSNGEIIIDNKVYSYTRNNSNELMGMFVEYYYDKDDNIIALVEEYEANTVKIITTKDIVGYSNNKYSYYDGNKIKNINISKDADVAYNGSVLSSFTTSFLVPANGQVKLIDTNSDNNADSVIIDNYDIYVVKGADSQNEMIFDKYEPTKILDLKKYEAYYITDDLGNNLNLSELNQNDVVSVAASFDKSVVKILYSNREFEGKVTAITQNGKSIIVNDAQYDVSASALSEAAKIKLGKNYIFLLDIMGNIASIISSEDSYRWGYLIAARETRGLDKAVVIKLFGEDGAMHYFEVRSDIILNTEKTELQSLYNALLDGNSKVQSGIVRYRFEGDRLIEIDRDVDNYYTGYNPDKTPLKKIRWTKSASAFGGKIAVNEATKYFALPIDDDAQDDEYQIITTSYFKDNEIENCISAYRENTDSHIADVIVTYAESFETSIGQYAPIRIVEQIVQAIDPEGNAGIKIKFAGGEEAFVKDNNVLNGVKSLDNPDVVHNLVCGDIIRFSRDANNLIKAIELVYDRVGKKVKGDPSVNYDDVWGVRVVLANVYSKENDNLLITKTSLDTPGITVPYSDVETLFANKFTIYKCYVSRGEYVVEEGSVSDIYDYKTMGASHSKIVVSTTDGQPRNIIIYQ